MTAGQINIWRADVRRAMFVAVRERCPFSEYRYEIEKRLRIINQVQRATFCAKLEGVEYSRLKRR